MKKLMKRTNVRWTVVALIFFATTVNYIDRQVIGLLKPYIQDDLGWTEADYGYIVTAFQVAYGIGMIVGGRMLDRLGSKLGYSIAIIVWSLGPYGFFYYFLFLTAVLGHIFFKPDKNLFRLRAYSHFGQNVFFLYPYCQCLVQLVEILLIPFLMKQFFQV